MYKRILFLIVLTSTLFLVYFISLDYRTSVCLLEYSLNKPVSPVNETHLPSNSTTIITAFFHFGKSKHSSNEYESWIENFLPYVTTPM
ncbi:hypothetical protein Bhyg_00642, partial [Pseudolycoriella hygida]